MYNMQYSTKTVLSYIWQNFRHWQHWKLKWQKYLFRPFSQHLVVTDSTGSWQNENFRYSLYRKLNRNDGISITVSNQDEIIKR